MDKVLVMLSTYNGVLYLEEQLASILAQKGVEVFLRVRDDGSTDQTVEILQEWARRNPNIVWSAGKNKGWAASFMDLVYESGEYDYYAFADQDDIWLPDKLSHAVAQLKKMPEGPQLYFSNIRLWKNGRDIGMWKSPSLRFDKYTSMVQCVATGNTMVFNSELCTLLCEERRPSAVLAHDYWVFQVAVLLGNVVYDSGSCILYRQHGKNEVGADRNIQWNIKRKWGDVKKMLGDHRRENQAKELLECYSDRMSPETVRIVEGLAFYRKSIGRRLQLLFSTKYCMDTFLRTALLKVRVIGGHV